MGGPTSVSNFFMRAAKGKREILDGKEKDGKVRSGFLLYFLLVFIRPDLTFSSFFFSFHYPVDPPFLIAGQYLPHFSSSSLWPASKKWDHRKRERIRQHISIEIWEPAAAEKEDTISWFPKSHANYGSSLSAELISGSFLSGIHPFNRP